ncbi:hypothetical protein [Undibacterium sp. Di24W]|uniref:hypothetical protein n=1 Tax=Undibacterium sp. Di24W TaxID=3413033 RepID=UPI003BF3995F
MNNALFEKAKKILASLTAAELESKLSAYGIAYTTHVVMFEDVDNRLDESAEYNIAMSEIGGTFISADDVLTINFALISANDNSYALAA